MLLNPLTQSIRRILFVRSDWLTKAEQLGLFDMPVLVKPHVKNGKVVRAYNRIQKKRLHPAPQAELFGDAPPKTESAKLGRLGHFIEKHGGYKRLYATLHGLHGRAERYPARVHGQTRGQDPGSRARHPQNRREA